MNPHEDFSQAGTLLDRLFFAVKLRACKLNLVSHVSKE